MAESVQVVSIEWQVVGEFDDIRTLSGGHNLRGSMIHRHNCLSQLTAGFFRPSHLRVEVIKGSQGGAKRGGVVIRVKQLHCAPRRMRCPIPGARNAVRMGTASVQSSRRYHVQGCAVSHQKREGPCRGREDDGTDHCLSTISVPLIVHALMFEGGRGEFSKDLLPRAAYDQRTGGGPKHVSLLSAAVGTPCEKLSDGVLVVLPVGPGAGLGEVAFEGFSDAGPLNVAEHVHKVQVGHHHRLQSFICFKGLKVALQCPSASHTPGGLSLH